MNFFGEDGKTSTIVDKKTIELEGNGSVTASDIAGNTTITDG
jgi:hypothetical protein